MSINGGWTEFPINNFKADPKSPLSMAYNLLNQILAKKNIEFVKFDKILG